MQFDFESKTRLDGNGAWYDVQFVVFLKLRGATV